MSGRTECERLFVEVAAKLDTFTEFERLRFVSGLAAGLVATYPEAEQASRLRDVEASTRDALHQLFLRRRRH